MNECLEKQYCMQQKMTETNLDFKKSLNIFCNKTICTWMEGWKLCFTCLDQICNDNNGFNAQKMSDS